MKTRFFSYLTTILLGGFANASAEPPNIIYILADDLGYGDVQVLNPERGKILTPHMDQVAAEGMTFTDAHTTCLLYTSPSPRDLSTSRMPSSA